jgi:cysteine desulfurase
MGEAFALSESIRVEEQAQILRFRKRLWDGIKHLPGIHLNGDITQRVAGNLNFSFTGIDGEVLLPALCELAVSTTSACSSASAQPSYVLRALGLSNELAKSSIRLSLGRFTTSEEIDEAIAIICRQIPLLITKK